MVLHVLGFGAVGSLLAAHLRKHANDAVKVMTRTPDAYNSFIQGGNEITIERDGQQLCAEDIGCELVPRTRTITPAQFGHPFINAKTLAEQQDQDDGRQSQGNIDSLFVTTKAQSVLPAIHSIVPRMSARSTIVLLQNGGGLVDALIHDIFPEEHLRPNFIVGVNSHGVYKKSAGHIVDDTRHSNAHTVWAGSGSIPFAVMPNVHTQAAIAENTTHPSANPLLNMSSTTPHPTLSHLPITNDTKGLYATLSAMLSCTPLKFEWLRLPELLRIQQQKIAVNCVINPLTAIFDVQNGVILEPNLIEMARSICYEVSNVFAAQARNDLLRNARSGEEMQDEDKYIVSQGAFPPAHVLSYESLHARAMQVARLTDANLSSMLADIRHGAPETEIDYINGFISRLGRQVDVPTPINDSLSQMVKFRTTLGRRSKKDPSREFPSSLTGMRISDRYGATYKPQHHKALHGKRGPGQLLKAREAERAQGETGFEPLIRNGSSAEEESNDSTLSERG